MVIDMFSKNLKYYRLKNNMTQKELASLMHVTPMTISYYESGERRPSMDTIKELAQVLGVKVTDFLGNRNENLVFVHGEFRKNNKLLIKHQDFIKESVEEYFGRFYSVVDVLGGEVLPNPPVAHQLNLSKDAEKNALDMRKYLKISGNGPVGNLTELLENKGILIYLCDITNDAFSGMNGFVNERPYIIVNKNMSPERMRSTIAHELAHLLFVWPEEMEDKEIEDAANAISGAFLFPAEDALRELGIRRTAITKDMNLTCREYGISMYLLVKRASLCNIINERVAKDFYIRAGKAGWRKNEPVRIEKEEPIFFAQLVYRAVSENEISVQKGAELLKKPYSVVADNCSAEEG